MDFENEVELALGFEMKKGPIVFSNDKIREISMSPRGTT